MRFFILLLALAIVAFSTFATATPTDQKRGGEISRVPKVNDNQKRDVVDEPITNWKRGDSMSRVPSAFMDKKSLVGRQANKCSSGYHWCYDSYGGCCPNNSVCSYPDTCTPNC
ncbi:hypothetical protein RclHR1_01570019 [Rhizophagus clarus]|uniref:Granulins domain-containing protein n=1 Tax=Rhizophagus clarus TaxID=94130 RepID=A0A140D0A3_9GLOM|nr:hypothetical protein [Rhizophagus clarus]GBB89047.1 hypothetical protein RclHR1_01570019 [Rhizophagus clarus]GES80908.1 hypothetical protein GLOIN_2v1870075 [Rhizophagus clarus]